MRDRRPGQRERLDQLTHARLTGRVRVIGDQPTLADLPSIFAAARTAR
jgi:hypothetical protein